MTKQQFGRFLLCLALCFAPVAFGMYVFDQTAILQPAII
jgi:hypothetical protein